MAAYINGPSIPTSEDEAPTERSAIAKALEELGEILVKKNKDYRPTGYEFSNFSFASHVSGVNIQDIMLAQIGIKLGRIQGLLNGLNKDVSFESLEDSVKDLAGYSVLLYAYHRSLNG